MKTMDIHELKSTIKQVLIIERLKLEDITAEEIEDNMSLFGDGLGLDSVEAFEMIVGIEQVFGVNVDEIPADELKQHMYSVDTIANFLENNMNKIES